MVITIMIITIINPFIIGYLGYNSPSPINDDDEEEEEQDKKEEEEKPEEDGDDTNGHFCAHCKNEEGNGSGGLLMV